MSVTITISTKLFNHLKKCSEEFEDLPDDFNPDDQYGGNADDVFWGGASYGEGELAARIIGSYEANKV